MPNGNVYMDGGNMAVESAGDMKSSFFYFTLPIFKESKQANRAKALMALKVWSFAPLSGAAPFLRTYRLG
jgi:hypothetical protein